MTRMATRASVTVNGSDASPARGILMAVPLDVKIRRGSTVKRSSF